MAAATSTPTAGSTAGVRPASMRLSDMRRAGVRPLLLGAVLWVLVACSSLGLQAPTGTL